MADNMTDDDENEDKETQDSMFARRSAGLTKSFVLPAGTLLFSKGDIRHCAYLINKGKIAIIDEDEEGNETQLCVMEEGEIFGEMALIDDMPRTAGARTLTETEVFVIPREVLRERTYGLDPIVSLLMSLLIERYNIARSHVPEAIKQDNVGDFIQKSDKHENFPLGVLRLRNSREQREIALTEMKQEEELLLGLERKEFFPVLQPIVTLPDQKLAGFEALIRWQHPEKGLIMPDDFIPIAEKTGIVQDLDYMMLGKVFEILPNIIELANGSMSEDFFISVNFSGIHFSLENVVKTVHGMLKEAKINPSYIKIEITESALIADPELAEEVLIGFKSLGLSVALDDFGTGYCSLSYLHKFSIDDLKIDRSFIQEIHGDSKSLDIIGPIVTLARNFDLGIIAEGIEKEEDIIPLTCIGCDLGQGFYFSHPLPVEEAYEYTKKKFAAEAEARRKEKAKPKGKRKRKEAKS